MNQTSKKHRQAPRSTERARSLRQDSTTPERILWGILRNRQLDGHKFRRQHPIGPFVTDFYCAEASLIVELDGESHVGQHEQDQQRTAYLNQHGLRVLRVTNDDLLGHPDAVADAIGRAVEAGSRDRKVLGELND